jgi:hypothetical protein
MTSRNEITRTADRLTDALGAAANVMTVADSPALTREPTVRHAWKWLIPLAAAASVVAIALLAAFAPYRAESPMTPATTPPSTPPSALPSSSASASDGPATWPAADAPIGDNWKAFFNPSTPNSTRVELLQNGQLLAATVAAVWSYGSPMEAPALQVRVDSVTLTSATRAIVKYDIVVAGSRASPQSGIALLEGGVWKVADTSFCGLLKLNPALRHNVQLPSACK